MNAKKKKSLIKKERVPEEIGKKRLQNTVMLSLLYSDNKYLKPYTSNLPLVNLMKKLSDKKEITKMIRDKMLPIFERLIEHYKIKEMITKKYYTLLSL